VRKFSGRCEALLHHYGALISDAKSHIPSA
jgi:hypothetical protein